MKTESYTKPNKFEIELLKNGKITVIFFDNITEITEIFEDEETTKYEYDMYKITLNNRINLAEDIENNYNMWLQFAKDCEYEKLATEIRTRRDKLLTETDWTQVTDTVLSDQKQEEYKNYRQQLRDITEQEDFPHKVVFPSKPVQEKGDGNCENKSK